MLSKLVPYPKLEFSNIAIPLNEKWESSELIRLHNEGFLPKLITMRSNTVNRIFWANGYNTDKPLIQQGSDLKLNFKDGSSDIEIFEQSLGKKTMSTLRNSDKYVLTKEGSSKNEIILAYRGETYQKHNLRKQGYNLRIEKEGGELFLTDFKRVYIGH